MTVDLVTLIRRQLTQATLERYDGKGRHCGRLRLEYTKACVFSTRYLLDDDDDDDGHVSWGTRTGCE